MDREQWLEQRRYRDGIGFCIQASEWAAILGFDEHRGPLDVYVAKKKKTQLQDNDQLLLGHCMEPGIALAYHKKTGRPVFDPGDFEIFQHHDIPWLGATLDRQTWKSEEDSQSIPGAPLELKHVGSYNSSAWKDDTPLWLQIQLQAQIACSNAEWGAYCAVVGGSAIHLGDIERNNSFIYTTIPVLEEFKWRLDNDKPPEPTSPKCLEPIKTLYPLDNGETIKLADEHLDLVSTWETAKTFSKEIEDHKKEIEAKLRAVMGDATFGILPDGTMLTLKTTNNKGGTRVVGPYSYRTLRRTKVK